MHDDIERVLFDEAEIREGIERVAQRISAAFGTGGLTVVAVLKGSCVFVADLIRRLPDPLRLSFVMAESYRDGSSPGALELHGLPPPGEIAGQRVLLVDDILDSGRTLDAVRRVLLERGAREVHTCVFLNKVGRRVVDLQPDFSCFSIDDEFVVGCGLDYAGRYRNLPYVGVLKPLLLGSASRERA